MGLLTGPRVALYTLLWICSAILLGLTAARIHNTRAGFHFYEPIVVELLVASCLFLLWAPFAIAMILAGAKTFINIADVIVLFVIWIITLVGAAISTRHWHALGFCWRFSACRLLTAIVSFAWITWVLATILMIMALAGMGNRDDTPGYTRRGGRGRNYETRAADDQHVTTGAAAPATGPTTV